MAANYYPDGLTIEVITALEHEVDEELQAEGYPAQPVVSAPMRMPPRRTRGHRNGRSSSRTGNSPTPSPPTVDAPARNHGRSHGQRGRRADDAASSPGSR